VPSTQHTTTSGLATDLCLIAIFLLLAGWFMFGADAARVPAAGTPTFDDTVLSGEPVRDFRDLPQALIGPYEYRCSECHGLILPVPPPEADDPPYRYHKHKNIVLDHGINDRCFYCHDRVERNFLILRSGEQLPFREVARLCASCHGPTYRDWQMGMHGRTTITWDSASPEQGHLRCTECHDPHRPAFGTLPPLPPPNTLRMGERQPADHGGPVESLDPLRKWQTMAPHDNHLVDSAGDTNHAEATKPSE
jgi:hypothetical protein